MRSPRIVFCLGALAAALGPVAWFAAAPAAEFRGRVVDGATGRPIPARIYLQSQAGEKESLFVKPASTAGTALPYEEEWVPMPQAVEKHTTISAHPFVADLPPGEYSIEIERGKEYFPLRHSFTIGDRPVEMTFRLDRWIDLAERGWYSGETHVHRRISELPNVMLAEDLNVAFPVTFWTVRSDRPPDLEPSTLRRQGPSPFGPREDRGAEPIEVDRTHVIVPRNTEYEIFSIGEKRHTLGAIFLLNHRTAFTETAPPIGPIAEKAHAEGALLDLDKHSWPWSMMLVPVAKVDLFELSNNSVWRTQFGFSNIASPLPEWMNVEQDSPTTMTEWGWLNYGFESYYALLNCGFKISPTAGTASGVHPVPLGYSRVYVHTGDEFTLDAWLKGLKAGRSFVTTGPMLFATVDGALPGEAFDFAEGTPRTVRVSIETVSQRPISAVEIVLNGRVVESLKPAEKPRNGAAHRTETVKEIQVDRTSWLAVRCIEPQEDGRKRFAHTAPWHVTLAGAPITPVREEVENFIFLLEAELARNRGVLDQPSLAEFEQALAHYRNLLPRSAP
jgi:hypothetical protein